MSLLDNIIELDTQLFLYLNSLGTESWDWFWLFTTHRFSWIPLYIFLVGYIFYKEKWKRGVLILVCLALLITVVDQTTYHFFKNGIQRLRPCHNEEIKNLVRLVKDSCGGRYGFFSSHASNSFAFAVFIGSIFSRYYRLLMWFFVFWACLVSYSRIYVGVHYPLDILCGSVYGLVYGFFFKKGLKLILNKKLFI